MTNWQANPPPDNDGHAGRYNPDTARTDPFLVGLFLFAFFVVATCLFYGLRIVYRDKIVGITYTVLTFAVVGLHFLLDVPYVGKGYLITVMIPILVMGFIAAIIDIVKFCNAYYDKREEEANR